MKKAEIAKMIDHTLLKAFATPDQVRQICKEAIEIGAASVCVNPVNVPLVKECLAGSSVKVCTVIGFPLGANTPAVKAFETRDATANGAQEVDMVINIGAAKAGSFERVYEDIKAVVEAANGVLTKVILEICYLTDEEIVACCKAAERAGADFVKTSTGYGPSGANARVVALMKEAVGRTMKIKASGGMRKYEDVIPNIEAGADRLGISASIAVLAGAEE